MKNAKKMMALALAASMVMSSSVVAFAADGDAAATSGGTQGSGAVEGHVDKEVLNVVLPTDGADGSLFAYTMDPERLVQGTDAAKYAEGTVFPAAASDTGVYFLTEENTYANTSSTYQVINKSSCDVTLTVKVKATASAGGKDITLANNESAVASATTPSLYLGLNVGTTKQDISATEATVTKTIAGTKNNFKIAVVEGENSTKKYVYQEKADASTWKAMNINMTGKVNDKDIAADTTAPTVDVTWSWAKAADGVTADTDAVDYVAGPQITVSATGLITVTGLTATRKHVNLEITNTNGTYDANSAEVSWGLDNYSEETGGSYTCQLGEAWLETLRGFTGGKAVVNLSDGSKISADINIPEATD